MWAVTGTDPYGRMTATACQGTNRITVVVNGTRTEWPVIGDQLDECGGAATSPDTKVTISVDPTPAMRMGPG